MVDFLEFNTVVYTQDYKVSPDAKVITLAVPPVGVLTFQARDFPTANLCEVQNKVYYDTSTGDCLCKITLLIL